MTSILVLCLTNSFFRALQEYNQEGKWIGYGPEKCTDPLSLREAITPKPEEFITEISINTIHGERIFFSANDSLGSFWKPKDFVYDPVSFNRYDPIVSVCYELNVPKSLQTQGIQFIDITMNRTDLGDFVKFSPPGYLHQNTDVRTRKTQVGTGCPFRSKSKTPSNFHLFS